MAESISFTKDANRETIYREILPQIVALIEGETDAVANMANVAAVLKEAFGFFWVGFYILKDDELVLGPFQGPLACTRISPGKGVCGTAFENGETIVVPDVDAFPGHIACSSASRSEIVVPLFDAAGNTFGVLDVDSDRLGDFSEVDAAGLGKIAESIAAFISPRQYGNSNRADNLVKLRPGELFISTIFYFL